jgi:hypothetical protein
MHGPPVDWQRVDRQVFAEHAKEQQSALPVQDSPAPRQVGPPQSPPAHAPAQQSVSAAQR